jgi:S-adenosylmethionine:tRNA ribosyltransferase-isomerase
MHISEFDYELPLELIAREPVRPRDASRMMIIDRQANTFSDSVFVDLPNVLRSDDVLVINDTRVIKARMSGQLQRSTGTTRQVEVLFANPISETVWEVLCKPGRRIRPGDRVDLAGGAAVGRFGELRQHGLRLLDVTSEISVPELLERSGHVPLPPYMERSDNPSDATEYQTIFAEQAGAVAAPTAGLHFTPGVLQRLSDKGIEVVHITLHIGIGTFLPVRVDDPHQHQLKPELFHISEDAAEKLRQARRSGRRIIAVGTTSTRTLEDVVRKHGNFYADSGYADMYILPGHQFCAIQGLLTNFHLPRSTLLMLVSAFASRELILHAYRHAIEQRYRFYSYGDCMLILNSNSSVKS